MARTLVLGAGFGGIAVATDLRERLGREHEVVLVDRHEGFSMGLRKLWELAGIGTIAEGRRSRRLLDGGGVRFVQAEVEAIDPATRAATVGGERLEADALVVALGARPRPDLVPGLVEHAHDVWQADLVPAAARALARFEGGRLGIVIAGAPYPCPPAPYECALLVEEHLRRRGIRERTRLSVTTFQPILLPNAGPEGSAAIGERLAERGIAASTGRQVEAFEPGRVVYGDGVEELDLVIAVPPYRAPEVVEASGLTGEGRWVGVDRGTLETSFPGVYAVGDVTQIPLANGLPLPKAGLFAELEGLRVAAAIAARSRGDEEPPPFDGRGFCFLELGESEATLVEGDFFAEPQPSVRLLEPSVEHARAKRRFEDDRLARWFGG